MAGERWRIGDITVTRIIEIEAVGGLRRILPDADYDAVRAIPWLFPHFADAKGRLAASIHALVIETPDCRIVVDTCIGNDKVRAVPAWNQLQTGFLADLTAAGYPPDSVDQVLCTHLHVDHVGWNTRLENDRWVPTFTNARYLFGADEFEFWRARGDDERFGAVFSDSVAPVFDAGLVDLIATDHQVAPVEPLLQRANARRHGRLGDVQVGGGAVKTAGRHHFQKGMQMVNVHGAKNRKRQGNSIAKPPSRVGPGAGVLHNRDDIAIVRKNNNARRKQQHGNDRHSTDASGRRGHRKH